MPYLVAMFYNGYGFVQLGKSKLKSSFQHKSQIEKLLLMLAHQPQLHKTDVGG